MNGAVTPAGITADLEAMKEAGIGGAYLMPIKDVENPPAISLPARQFPAVPMAYSAKFQMKVLSALTYHPPLLLLAAIKSSFRLKTYSGPLGKAKTHIQ